MKPSLSKSAKLVQDTFDLYSKLLAKEKIQVVFNEKMNASAMFDIINRVLYICPLDTSQAFLIPGLVVHEVGHALFSILSSDDISLIGGRITKLLNIIDDGYQERMMCKKYPNTKQHLFTIFDHFFIKLGEEPYNTDSKIINIVNTLNYNCKGLKHNYHRDYPDYVLKEDIIKLHQAEILNEHNMVERYKYSEEIRVLLKKYSEDDEDDKDEDDKDELKSDNSEKTKNKDNDGNTDSKDTKKTKNSSKQKNDCVEQELEDNEYLLNDHHDKIKHVHGNNNIFEVINGQELLDLYGMINLVEDHKKYNKAVTEDTSLASSFQAHNKIAKKTAQRIINNFNARKAASDLARTQYKKSGSLDPTRAALYKVYDDVFENISISPDEVNHSYVVALDWSGSMSWSIKALMFRIMELIHFAEGTGVELKVFTYAESPSLKKIKKFSRNIATTESVFISIYDSKIHKGVKSIEALKSFWGLVAALNGSYGDSELTVPHGSALTLGGTNIYESYALGHYLLSQSSAHKKTLFALTDGKDGGNFSRWIGANGKNLNSGKLYMNGWSVDTSKYDSKTTASTMINEMYASVGQKTVAVAWEMDPGMLEDICGHAIEARSSGEVDSTGYIHSENAFITEITKHLI